MKTFLKIFCAISILCGAAVFTQAQNSVNLTLGKKKTIKKVFRPKTLKSKTFLTFYAARNRTLDIKIDSDGVDLGDEYPCYLYFLIYDKKGKLASEGDYPEGGADEWRGKLKRTGNYRIEIFVSGIGSCEEEIFKKKKPKFSYTLEITLKK